MSNTIRYKILFTPLDSFFWGGEKTFGADNENYFVKSRFFPQQTTILGTLRFEFLQQNNLFIKTASGLSINDKNEAKRIVGNKSFDVDAKSCNEFGMIKSLSPVFISYKNDNGNEDDLYVMPFDEELNLVFEKGNSLFNINKDFIPFYTNYNPKKSPQNCFIGRLKNTKLKTDIFIEKTQVGIQKDYAGATDENSFFKQKALGLNNNFSFAVILETDINLPLLKPSFVKMGSNRSVFKMEINEEFQYNTSEIFKPKSDRNRIVLLSDAFVSEDIHKFYDFAKINSISFRNIKTSESTKNFYANPKKGNDISKSEKYNIIERASVFYVQDKDMINFETQINKQYLKNIGYNCYQVIKP